MGTAREFERAADRHPGVERALAGRRDRRAVGERVAVGNPQFD